MNWPQITWVVLTTITGTWYLCNHEKPREAYNFVHWVLALLVELTILTLGGFFG